MPDLELAVGGDFNRWDTLWRGDHLASHLRQGEGRSILEFMTDLDLQLLLPFLEALLPTPETHEAAYLLLI